METPRKQAGLSTPQVIGLVIAAMLLTMVVTLLVVRSWLFAKPFEPVVLAPAEAQRLEQKLARFEQGSDPGPMHQPEAERPGVGELRAEPYTEDDLAREIMLTEREINAMIARNTDLARKVAVGFTTDLISLHLLIPMDPDLPFVGGKTLRVRAGATLAFRGDRPVFILRGVSVMGIPLPNAWIGGLKNIDLVEVFGAEPGFWQGFADGVAAVEVGEGSLRIQLRE
ncbi:arginine N-succinyltransferase [Desulfobulbus alkaliphilus]|uniref:arginine N-succinyltransferase n=1 Tax=Desulfobulbus alkaliphilus TaxID=869814 RepID=UPI0019625F89|nr:arginine N-succinyltransferase [Desulfobulbus alkaliphilus]MBM9537035.1 arginine N-succinyltransferase [Desulfobulbus alkaliphilus]